MVQKLGKELYIKYKNDSTKLILEKLNQYKLEYTLLTTKKEKYSIKKKNINIEYYLNSIRQGLRYINEDEIHIQTIIDNIKKDIINKTINNIFEIITQNKHLIYEKILETEELTIAIGDIEYLVSIRNLGCFKNKKIKIKQFYINTTLNEISIFRKIWGSNEKSTLTLNKILLENKKLNQ